jgi:putative flippase GtrA
MRPARLARFASVGLATAAIYYGLAWVLFSCLIPSALLAGGVACASALAFNYHAHYHWTFSADAPHGVVFTRYLAMVAVSTLLNAAIMYWGVDVQAWNFLLVQTLAAGAMICWSLCASNFWVFRDA